MRVSYVDQGSPVSVLIGGCNGPFTEDSSASSGTEVRILPLPDAGNDGGYDVAERAANKRVGQTPVTVSQLVEILQADGGADALFRRLPELDPQDVRDAVDYAARWGLLR